MYLLTSAGISGGLSPEETAKEAAGEGEAGCRLVAGEGGGDGWRLPAGTGEGGGDGGWQLALERGSCCEAAVLCNTTLATPTQIHNLLNHTTQLSTTYIGALQR